MSNHSRSSIATIANIPLEFQLTGFWADDVWPFSEFPDCRATVRSSIDFQPLHPKLRSELKFACWLQFTGGDWSMSHRNAVMRGCVLRRIITVLGRLTKPPDSLMDYSLAEWDELISVEWQHQRQPSSGRVDDQQIALIAAKRGAKILATLLYTFHGIYKTVQRRYSDTGKQSEYDQDIWELSRITKVSPQDRRRTLNFTGLQQAH